MATSASGSKRSRASAETRTVAQVIESERKLEPVWRGSLQRVLARLETFTGPQEERQALESTADDLRVSITAAALLVKATEDVFKDLPPTKKVF